MFSVQIPDAFVLGTSSLYICVQITRSLNCSRYHGVQICNHSLTSMHYTAQRENSLVGMIDRLTLGHNARSPQLCTKPRPFEHVLGTTAFRLRFGGVLRGWFVPRTWFDHVPAGTVLVGTVPARTRSDYKKWCVPRTCSRAGTVPRTSVNARLFYRRHSGIKRRQGDKCSVLVDYCPMFTSWNKNIYIAPPCKMWEYYVALMTGRWT